MILLYLTSVNMIISEETQSTSTFRHFGILNCDCSSLSLYHLFPRDKLGDARTLWLYNFSWLRHAHMSCIHASLAQVRRKSEVAVLLLSHDGIIMNNFTMLDTLCIWSDRRPCGRCGFLDGTAYVDEIKGDLLIFVQQTEFYVHNSRLSPICLSDLAISSIINKNDSFWLVDKPSATSKVALQTGWIGWIESHRDEECHRRDERHC
jgi:hypothetical protein